VQLAGTGEICERVFVPEFRYTVAEYDPRQPWLLVGEIRRRTVELEDADTFTAWAARRWPPPQYKAELEPETLGPWQGASSLARRLPRPR
jgi:hypothetical protein